MRRRILTVITLSIAAIAVLETTLGIEWHSDECDVGARGLIAWSDNRDELGLPRDGWVTFEPAPEGAELPPCRVGSKKKTDPGEFRPV